MTDPEMADRTYIEPITPEIIEEIIRREKLDMGVNHAGFGIVDDQVVQEVAHQEIIRRYFRCSCEYAMGLVDREILDRSELIMNNIG